MRKATRPTDRDPFTDTDWVVELDVRAGEHLCLRCEAYATEIDTPQIQTEHYCKECKAFTNFKRGDFL